MSLLFEAFTVSVGIIICTAIATKFLSLFAGGGTSLVIKTLDIDKAKTAGVDTKVHVAGRREGLVSFLLTLVGISPTTTLNVSDTELVCRTSGILGTQIRSFSLDRIAQVVSGSKAAVEFIFCAIATGIFGLWTWGRAIWGGGFLAIIGVPLIVALFIALSLLLYYLNKRFYVGVLGQGGWPVLLIFKPNVIEGVELNLDKAIELSEVIQQLVVSSGLSQLNKNAKPQPAVYESPSSIEALEAADNDSMPLRSTNLATPEQLFDEARVAIKAKDRVTAITKLRLLVDEYPETYQAQQAQKALEAMQPR